MSLFEVWCESYAQWTDGISDLVVGGLKNNYTCYHHSAQSSTAGLWGVNGGVRDRVDARNLLAMMIGTCGKSNLLLGILKPSNLPIAVNFHHEGPANSLDFPSEQVVSECIHLQTTHFRKSCLRCHRCHWRGADSNEHVLTRSMQHPCRTWHKHWTSFINVNSRQIDKHVETAAVCKFKRRNNVSAKIARTLSTSLA